MTRTHVQAPVICEQLSPQWQRFYLQDLSAEYEGNLPEYILERFGRNVQVFGGVLALTTFLIDYPCVITKLYVMPLAD